MTNATMFRTPNRPSHVVRRDLAVKRSPNLAVWIAFLGIVIAPFQIYTIQIGGVYPSLYLILECISIIIMIFYAPWKLNVGAVLLLLLVLYECTSIAWSPDPLLGLREILYSLPFLSLYIIGVGSNTDISESIDSTLRKYCIISAGHSCLVATFLLFPSIESAFWLNPLARIVINPNGISAFNAGIDNNVTDPWKAGGFFLNGNVSAVMSEIAGFISIYLGSKTHRKVWYLIALMNFGGAFASGSKAAMIMVSIVPVLTYFIVSIRARSQSSIKLLVLILAAVCVFGAAYFVVQWFLIGSELMSDAEINAQRRSVIWGFALSEFQNSPILGLGYGGWPIKFASFGYMSRDIGIAESMAPHNSLIYFWAQSGIIAPVLAVSFVFYSLKNIVIRESGRSDFMLRWSACGALLSLFFHSLSENYTIFNEPHFQAPVALLLGYASKLGAADRTKH